ncbi:iron-containing alcohol dehydrogenase [Planctobacterium marinum]|uniref:Alcohol dehydrogenase n=1 Tax=Planctobacterium marinum TaxID=1631968 RepID=A0AA48HS95_9ALTE|nr:alcohol dehydrogenase [Planctobacterium marinum]
MQSVKTQPQVVKESTDIIASISEALLPGETLLITSQSFTTSGITSQLVEELNGPVHVLDTVTSHPQLDFVEASYGQFRERGITNVVCLGGGSVIDVAKVIAGMLPGTTKTVTEVVKEKKALTAFSGRSIAIPTTSGTGAEVTAFATLWDKKSARKYSITCSKPDVVIFEPGLCLSLPRQTTLYAALDAISHAVESLWNVNRTPESEELAIKALQNLLSGLPEVLSDPNNRDARKQLQWGAWFAGSAINITKTAVAHAISYPLTLHYNIPHGLACSFTLRAILEDSGAAQLKIPEDIADNLINVLENLSLKDEMRRFVGWRNIVDDENFYLDPARSENFIFPVDTRWAKKIVLASP